MNVVRQSAVTCGGDVGVVLKGVNDDDNDDGSHQRPCTVLVKTHDHDERIDGFWEHYRPYELTVLGDQYSLNMPNSVRCFSYFEPRTHNLPEV